jgi:16S rRNA (uracil1498-N3)-methyltransferase
LGTPRLYVDLPLAPGRELGMPRDAAAHVARVLRLRPGDAVVLFNGDGRDYAGRLLAARREDTRVLVGSAGEAEPEPPLRLHLAVGVSRGERMDFVIQKAVELGVASIRPLFTERSVVRLDAERMERRNAHWHGVLVAACEQSGRRRLPYLHPPAHLADWLPTVAGTALLLDPRAECSLAQVPAPHGEATLLVGPEGGLSADERARAVSAGFVSVRLGPRILRTETAPLAALAAMQVLWGDLR